MKREFLRATAVVILLVLLGPQQRMLAQAVHEPTVDERYRDTDKSQPETALPLLNPQQAKPGAGKSQFGDKPAPAYFGVTFDTQKRAAIVQRVQPGSPAEKAGLQAHDVIESIQGRQVKSYHDVLDAIAKMRPGDVLDIGLSRRMNVQTQAALAGVPTATPRSVGYPPDAPVSNVATPATEEHEAMPVPNDPEDARVKEPQLKLGPAFQNRDGSRQNDNDQDNRRFLGRLRRR